MHTVRNRTAMSRDGGEFRRLSKASEKQAPKPSPSFPVQVSIPPRKGPIIRDAPLPEPQALAEAALILPAPVLPPLPGAARPATAKPAGKAVGKQGQKTRQRKPAVRAARPKRTKAKVKVKVNDSPAKPPFIAVQAEFPDANPILASGVEPAALPRSRSLVDTRKPEMVARVVLWLDALSRSLVGQRLSRTVRKKSRIVPLPAPRQSLARTTAGRRAPPSRQPAPTSGGAGDELSHLRAENARLKAELARLATYALRPR